MTPLVQIIVDSFLAVLLVAAIAACWVVYKKLSVIKEGQEELKQVVDTLNQAVQGAQRSVVTLKETSVNVEARLQGEVRRAQAMADELSMISEAGSNLADRIEGGLTSGKEIHAIHAHDSNESVEKEPDSSARKEQKELLAALREAR